MESPSSNPALPQEPANIGAVPQIIEEERNGLHLSCDKSELQIDRIHAFLTDTYWAKGTSLEKVARSIEHSFCIGVYDDGAQVGFTRVITDFTTFAYLTDIYVEADYRGRGLADWMVDFTFRHPDLQGLRRSLLATRDAWKLYAKHGFKAPRNPERLMELRPAE